MRLSRGLAAIAVVAVLVLAVPVAARADAARSGPAPQLVPAASKPPAGLAVTVTWDGASIALAGSPADAFALGPGQTASVDFSFQGASGGATPTNASLLLRYFGLTLSTVGAAPGGSGGSGQAELNWSFGSFAGVTQGVYEVLAQLTDANGSLLFSEPFYVHVQARFVLGSAVAIFALVLAVAEAYWIVVVVRAGLARRWRFRSR
jgi:hypothetical protein